LHALGYIALLGDSRAPKTCDGDRPETRHAQHVAPRRPQQAGGNHPDFCHVILPRLNVSTPTFSKIRAKGIPAFYEGFQRRRAEEGSDLTADFSNG
jgi:hypothetical protein